MIRTTWIPVLVGALMLLLGACQAIAPATEPADPEPEAAASVPSPLDAARAADERYLRSTEAFLADRQKLQHARDLDSMLVERRYPSGVSTYRDSVEVRATALTLAMDGLSEAKLKRLERNGVDVLGMDWKRQRVGQAATAELVIQARVADVEQTQVPVDGFGTSVHLHVEEVLKGNLPNDTLDFMAPGEIVLRRKSGRTAQGRVFREPTELELIPGKRYILFLSHTLYHYYLQYPQSSILRALDEGRLPESAYQLQPAQRSRYFLERYPAVRLEWVADRQLEELLAEIERVREATQPALSHQ